MFDYVGGTSTGALVASEWVSKVDTNKLKHVTFLTCIVYPVWIY